MTRARDQARVEATAHGRTLTESRAIVGRIMRAGRGGSVSPEAMLAETSEPTLHTWMTVGSACDALGVGRTLDLVRWERE